MRCGVQGISRGKEEESEGLKYMAEGTNHVVQESSFSLFFDIDRLSGRVWMYQEVKGVGGKGP